MGTVVVVKQVLRASLIEKIPSMRMDMKDVRKLPKGRTFQAEGSARAKSSYHSMLGIIE